MSMTELEFKKKRMRRTSKINVFNATLKIFAKIQEKSHLINSKISTNLNVIMDLEMKKLDRYSFHNKGDDQKDE